MTTLHSGRLEDAMIRDILIGLHATAGTVAFMAGVAIVARVARAREPRFFRIYLGCLAILAATAGALVGWDWSTFGTGTKVGFAAFIMLALIMLAAGGRALRLAHLRRSGWRRGLVAAVGFTLISLFAGFVIVASLDAGAPGWAVAVIAVAGIAAGRQAVHWAEAKAASREEESSRSTPRPRHDVGVVQVGERLSQQG
jgi:hypothetical protein